MKHKKHLRKQSSGRSSVNAGGSEEKDLSDYEDVQGDGDEEQDDDEVGEISNAKYGSADGNYEKDEMNLSKKETNLDTCLEGKIISFELTTYSKRS